MAEEWIRREVQAVLRDLGHVPPDLGGGATRGRVVAGSDVAVGGPPPHGSCQRPPVPHDHCPNDLSVTSLSRPPTTTTCPLERSGRGRVCPTPFPRGSLQPGSDTRETVAGASSIESPQSLFQLPIHPGSHPQGPSGPLHVYTYTDGPGGRRRTTLGPVSKKRRNPRPEKTGPRRVFTIGRRGLFRAKGPRRCSVRMRWDYRSSPSR